MAGSKSMRYSPKAERELNETGLKVLGLINDRFAATVD